MQERMNTAAGLVGVAAGAVGVLAVAGMAMGQVSGWGPVQVGPTSPSNGPSDVDLADFNGDGLMDVLVASAGTTAPMRVLLGDGSGMLTAATIVTVGPNRKQAEPGDVDGDGHIDIVSNISGSGLALRVYINDGSGSFDVGFTEPTGPGQIGQAPNRSLALGDVDGDGDLDAFGVGNNDDVLILYLNDGSGSFEVGGTQPIPSGGQSVTAADLDADGIEQIILTENLERTVRVYTWDGTDLLEVDRQGLLTSQRDDYGIVAADLDNDGAVEIAIGAAVTLEVFENDGPPGYLRRVASYSIGDRCKSVAAGDLDGDGDIDLAAAQTNFGRQVRVFYNDGAGGFDTFEDVAFSESINLVTIGDFGDGGAPDLFSGGRSSDGLLLRINLTPTDPPAAFNLLTPTNGATGVARPDDLAAWGRSAALDWTQAAGFAVEYDVEIARDAAFSDLALAETVAETELPLPDGLLAYGDTYFWRITARNPAGDTPASGAPWSFTIVDAPRSDCPADFDGDGELTLFDFLAFQNAFDAGCP